MAATRTLAALGGACLALSAGMDGRQKDSDHLVDIGSHRLQMHQEGSGVPAVVVETGLADQLDKLKPLRERLAPAVQVVTYNRAGYGQSEPGPLPRDSVREADELKAVLEGASIPAPYVLVGHSLGALNVQAFAAKYPKAVAGLVLLDPPPLSFILGQEWVGLREMADRMTTEWEAIADSGAASADGREQAKSAFFRTIASEHREMFGQSAKVVSAIATFGRTPLVVIASGKPNPVFGDAAEKFQQYWVAQSRALAAKSTRGRFILAEQASHQIYVDAPDLVAEAVLSVVREARPQ